MKIKEDGKNAPRDLWRGYGDKANVDNDVMDEDNNVMEGGYHLIMLSLNTE